MTLIELLSGGPTKKATYKVTYTQLKITFISFAPNKIVLKRNQSTKPVAYW